MASVIPYPPKVVGFAVNLLKATSLIFASVIAKLLILEVVIALA